MKSRLFSILLTALVCSSGHAADLSEALQQGLLEEEANQNLNAAIQAYQTVLKQFEEQRRIASTAAFRLAESYRKQGKTNEARAQYARVLSDFADQSAIVRLSQQYLATNTAASSPASSVNLTNSRPNAVDAEQLKLLQEEIALVQQQVDDAAARQDRIPNSVLGQLKRDLLSLQRKLPTNAPPARQKVLIQEEIQQVQQLLDDCHTMVQAGRAQPSDELRLKRDLLGLQRELLAVQAPQPQFQSRLQTIVRRDESDSAGAASSSFQNRLNAIVRRAESDAPTDEENKEIQRVQEIIKNSPDLINDRSFTGQTRLHTAAAGGQLMVARFLLDNNAEVNATSTGKGAPGGVADQTPLHLAAWAGHKAMVELLLSHGAAVNARDSSGETPLHKAAAKGFQSVAQVLLDKGADVNAGGVSGPTPLQLAVGGRFKGMIELLLARQAQVNAPDAGGQTALMSAVQTRQPAFVQLLLDNHADINSRAKDGHSALTLSVQQRTTDITMLLLGRGADPNVAAWFQAPGSGTQFQDWTPLHYATYTGDIPLLEALLNKGAEGNPRDSVGRTPLSWAVIQKNIRIVKLLLDKKANPNIKDTDGQTPLGYIAQAYAGQQKTSTIPNPPRTTTPAGPELQAIPELNSIFEALVDHGADLNDWSSPMAPPLIWSVFYADTNLVARLLAKGADVNLKSGLGYTALHVAAANGATNLMETLLAKGAEINAQDDAGNSPLHYAAFNLRKAAVEVLLSRGAKPDIANREGLLPANMANADGQSRQANYAWGIPVRSNTTIPIPATPRNLTREQRDISDLLRPRSTAPPAEK